MAVAPCEGSIDTSSHANRQPKSTGRAKRSHTSQVMRGDAARSSGSPQSRSEGSNFTQVSLTTTVNGTGKTKEREKEPQLGRHTTARDSNTPARGRTAELVHQMQQLELPLRPDFENIRTSHELVSLPPPLFPPQPRRPTQTLSHVDEPLLGYDDRLIPLPLGSPSGGNPLPTGSQWPTVPTPRSRLLMSFPRRSHQLPPLGDSNSDQASQQLLQSRTTPPVFNYDSGMAGLDVQTQSLCDGKGNMMMDEDDDDELLDDDSLDMLVTTLARETARIEAARTTPPSAFNSNHASEAGDYEEDEGDGEEDNFRDHREYSSESSSHPSTPSANTPDASGRKSHGKGKAKPKRVRRACIVPGCGKRSRSLGLCIAHGGGRRCIVEGCDKSSQGGNHCIKHGGGKRCSVDGCEKAAQTNSLCKAHGGGPRCQFEDCEKSSQGGGYCRQHGGGKRCAYAGCMKGTQRGSYCALHGGSRLCVVEGCKRNDRGGGYCAHHGGGKRCTIDMCTRPSRRNGLCSTHLRVLDKGEHSLDDLNESIDQGIKLTLSSPPSRRPHSAFE